MAKKVIINVSNKLGDDEWKLLKSFCNKAQRLMERCAQQVAFAEEPPAG